MKYVISNTKTIDGISYSVLGNTNNVNEVNKIINNYINDIKFKSYY